MIKCHTSSIMLSFSSMLQTSTWVWYYLSGLALCGSTQSSLVSRYVDVRFFHALHCWLREENGAMQWRPIGSSSRTTRTRLSKYATRQRCIDSGTFSFNMIRMIPWSDFIQVNATRDEESKWRSLNNWKVYLCRSQWSVRRCHYNIECSQHFIHRSLHR